MRLLIFVLGGAAALALGTPAPAGNFAIPWYTIDAGGGSSAAAEFVTVGTIGQHDASNVLAGGRFAITGGFWFPNEAPCPADLNRDGMVDGADLGILLAAWGPAAGNPADLNGDGMVDGADLGLLLAAWGPCP